MVSSRASSATCDSDGVVSPGWIVDSSIRASGCAAAGGSCDSNQPVVSISDVGRVPPLADG